MTDKDLFGGPRVEDVTLAQQIECVERELEQRTRVYPRMIAKGTMTRVQADREKLVMQAVLDTLNRMIPRQLR